MHVFECAVGKCKGKKWFVCCYLDTSDARSTSNLRHHAKACWGDEAVDAADATKDKNTVQAALESLKMVNGSIKAAFQQVASKGKPMYSTHQHTKIEAQYVQLEYLFDRDTWKWFSVLNSSAGSQRTTNLSKLSTIVVFGHLWGQGDQIATSPPLTHFLVMWRTYSFRFVAILQGHYRSDMPTSYDNWRTHCIQ